MLSIDSSKTVVVTVWDVVADLVRHPVENLLRRWNWKSAALSACLRGMLFFITNVSAGFGAAVSAMSIESAFYITTAGFYGAITQAFRKAQPAWAATLTIMLVLLVINHTLEWTLHWIAGTEKLARSITASIGLSMVSAVFNLYAMRRGVLIVGAGRQSLFADLRQMPRIAFDFLTAIPRSLQRGLVANKRREITEQTEITEKTEKILD
jgi:hypothetical protein